MWIKKTREFGIGYRLYFILAILAFFATFAEIFGISIFIPIFQFMLEEGDIESLTSSSTFWKYLSEFFQYFNASITLPILLLATFSFFLFRQIFTYLRMVTEGVIFENLKKSIRNKLFFHYLKADSEYHDSTPAGSFVNIMSNEVHGAIKGVMVPVNIAVLSVTAISYLVALLFISWQITIISTIVLFVVVQIPKKWIALSQGVGANLVDINSRVVIFLVEKMKSPRLVYLSGMINNEIIEFKKLTGRQKKIGLENIKLQAKTSAIFEPIIIFLVLCFVYFAYTFLNLNVVLIGLYLVAALRLIPTVKTILVQLQAFQSLKGAINIIDEKLTLMKKHVEDDLGDIVVEKINKIKFDNVSFKYSTGLKNAVNGISFTINAGEMIAFVGPSGGGKSTIVDLIPRLRVAQSGRITLNNDVDLSLFKLNALRDRIAYVSQDIHFFNTSVKGHICYGAQVSLDDYKRAMDLSGVSKFVNKLPDGDNTVVGENGVKLSGGQKQKVDIARALAKNSDVLILDEPTSSLDAQSELIFRDSINNIRDNADIMIIIIAHRLSTITQADKIFVIDGGRIASSGNHKELLNSSGWYRSAFKIQE